MISVVLDEDMYYTGQFSTVGALENSIEVSKLPNIYDTKMKQICYKYIEDDWVFDEQKYQDLQNSETTKKLNDLKTKKIQESKLKLAEFLESTTIPSTCHKGEVGYYSITNEKQQQLANMILTTTMAAQSEISYQPSWNQSGQPCTYDWTLEELQQLAFEIESVVRPLVFSQQTIETQINNAETTEEIDNIDITYKIPESE